MSDPRKQAEQALRDELVRQAGYAITVAEDGTVSFAGAGGWIDLDIAELTEAVLWAWARAA